MSVSYTNFKHFHINPTSVLFDYVAHLPRMADKEGFLYQKDKQGLHEPYLCTYWLCNSPPQDGRWRGFLGPVGQAETPLLLFPVIVRFTLALKNCSAWTLSFTMQIKVNFVEFWNFWHYSKIFFACHWWRWKSFFANFQILGPLGCQ